MIMSLDNETQGSNQERQEDGPNKKRVRWDGGINAHEIATDTGDGEGVDPGQVQTFAPTSSSSTSAKSN